MKPSIFIRTGLLSFLMMAAFTCFSSQSQAASGDPDGVYGVIITKIELSKDSGKSYLTCFEGYSDVNLIAASAGRSITRLIFSAPLAQGVYNRTRVTLGQKLYLQGYVNDGNTTIFTNGDNEGKGYELNAASADTPGSTYSVSAFTIPEDQRSYEYMINISVGAKPPALHAAFDLSGVITQAGGIPSVGIPSVTVTKEPS